MEVPVLTQAQYVNGDMADLPQHVIDFEHVSVEGRGVNLGDAYDGNVAALGNNRDAPAFDVVNMGVTAKITLRIQVIGAEPYYFRQVSAIRSNRTADSITLGKLAMTIAQEMNKYMESAGPIQYKGQTLELGNLVLTKLYHVSRGSWQPEFKVNIA